MRHGGAVGDSDADENVVGRPLGILALHIEITFLLKNSRVRQFKLGAGTPPPTVLAQKFRIGKRLLGIFVKRPHVAVGRRRIQIVIQLLDVLAVIAFVSVESVETFLQDGIVAVPQSKRKTQPRLPIGDAQQTVFPPAIRPRPRVIVRKITPTIPPSRVILSDGAPLTLRKIRTPALPVVRAGLILLQAKRFRLAHFLEHCTPSLLQKLLRTIKQKNNNNNNQFHNLLLSKICADGIHRQTSFIMPIPRNLCHNFSIFLRHLQVEAIA